MTRSQVSNWTSRRLWLSVLLILGGCGRPTELPGGTPGVLFVDGQPVSRIKVNVFSARGEEGSAPLAFGVTDELGRFELRQIGTLAGVWLEPGEYCFTVESDGEIPLVWPPAFRQPLQTPLRQTWESSSREIRLQLPAPRAKK